MSDLRATERLLEVLRIKRDPKPTVVRAWNQPVMDFRYGQQTRHARELSDGRRQVYGVPDVSGDTRYEWVDIQRGNGWGWIDDHSDRAFRGVPPLDWRPY